MIIIIIIIIFSKVLPERHNRADNVLVSPRRQTGGPEPLWPLSNHQLDRVVDYETHFFMLCLERFFWFTVCAEHRIANPLTPLLIGRERFSICFLIAGTWLVIGLLPHLPPVGNVLVLLFTYTWLYIFSKLFYPKQYTVKVNVLGVCVCALDM